MLSGVWLMACLLLLSAFSGQLREQILRPRKIHWIDTWDDLHEWKHLKIVTYVNSVLKMFTDVSPDDIYSKEFSKRFEIIDESLENTWDIPDIEMVKAGQVAVVYPHHALQIAKNTLVSDDFQEDIDFHISKYEYGENSDEMQPYYVMTSRESLNETLTKIFGLV